jgi:hypothetical protein
MELWMDGFKDECTNRYLDEYVIGLVKVLVNGCMTV